MFGLDLVVDDGEGAPVVDPVEPEFTDLCGIRALGRNKVGDVRINPVYASAQVHLDEAVAQPDTVGIAKKRQQKNQRDKARQAVVDQKGRHAAPEIPGRVHPAIFSCCGMPST